MASTQRDLSTGQAARILRCSQQTVIRACDTGEIPSYKLPGSRFRRIVQADLIDYMQQHNIPTGGRETCEQNQNETN